VIDILEAKKLSSNYQDSSIYKFKTLTESKDILDDGSQQQEMLELFDEFLEKDPILYLMAI
jgi:hypothetical protein